jgi:hypothetical protein
MSVAEAVVPASIHKTLADGMEAATVLVWALVEAAAELQTFVATN